MVLLASVVDQVSPASFWAHYNIVLLIYSTYSFSGPKAAVLTVCVTKFSVQRKMLIRYFRRIEIYSLLLRYSNHSYSRVIHVQRLRVAVAIPDCFTIAYITTSGQVGAPLRNNSGQFSMSSCLCQQAV